MDKVVSGAAMPSALLPVFDQQKSAPLSIISLGFVPSKNVSVSSIAAALLIAVRTGFIYGAAEVTKRADEGDEFLGDCSSNR